MVELAGLRLYKKQQRVKLDFKIFIRAFACFSGFLGFTPLWNGLTWFDRRRRVWGPGLQGGSVLRHWLGGLAGIFRLMRKVGSGWIQLDLV
jgi:hypothetical protein